MEIKKYNILYVDDEVGNLRVFQASFKKSYQIFTASSGQEALDILGTHDIHLIITDQKMPKMTGVELLEQLAESHPDIMKLILTGYSDVEDIIHALNKCGIYRYLMKPWQKEEMRLTLDKALEIYQLRKDRTELLEELQTTNEQLEDRINERTAELSETNRLLRKEIEERKIIERDLKEAKNKAEEATHAKQLFLSTMSHEIRTPLNAVIGMAYLLQQSDLDEAQQENLKLLLFSAQNLLTLINDILDLSRIDSGKLDMEQTPFNVTELVHNIGTLYRSKAEEQGLAYDLIIDEQLPQQVIGDPTRLGQVLNNLLSNAFKFTNSGSVKVVVEQLTAPNENPSDLKVSFSVIDTGIGVPDAQKEAIFEHFSQASSETTRKYGGTGLGLAIARKLVLLQGGNLTVESQEGQGSTFKFTLCLPKSDAAPKEEPVTPVVHFESLEQLNILLVEDNKINQILMRKFFNKWNVRYQLAVNGLEAVQLVQEKQFDVVLMDIQMPEMDGYAATQAIRALSDPYYQELPIIALTASTLQGEEVRVRAVGMNDYVVKPFAPQILASKILQHTQSNMQQASPQLQIDFSSFRSLMEGDQEGYKELILATQKDLEGLQDALKAYTADKNSSLLQIAAHNMRPPLEMMGLMDILRELRELREMKGNSSLLMEKMTNTLQKLHAQLSHEALQCI